MLGPDASDAWNCFRVLVKLDGVENKECSRYDCCAWIGPRDEYRDVRLGPQSAAAVGFSPDASNPQRSLLIPPLTLLPSNRRWLSRGPVYRPCRMQEMRDLEAQREAQRISLATGEPLRASATGPPPAPVDPFAPEKVYQKDHDGFQTVKHPMFESELVWYWRELLPVHWFKPVRCGGREGRRLGGHTAAAATSRAWMRSRVRWESLQAAEARLSSHKCDVGPGHLKSQETPSERLKQSEVAPKEFALVFDPEEVMVVGAHSLGGRAALTHRGAERKRARRTLCELSPSLRRRRLLTSQPRLICAWQAPAQTTGRSTAT